MHTLILIRHGDYNERGDKRLSPRGVDQIKELAKEIAKVVAGKSFRIIASDAIRADESAKILSVILNSDYKTNSLFRSGDGKRENLNDAYSHLTTEHDDVDVVIVVTHFEYCKFFPGHMAFAMFSQMVRYVDVKKGGAVIINVEEVKLEFEYL